MPVRSNVITITVLEKVTKIPVTSVKLTPDKTEIRVDDSVKFEVVVSLAEATPKYVTVPVDVYVDDVKQTTVDVSIPSDSPNGYNYFVLTFKSSGKFNVYCEAPDEVSVG